MKFKVGDTVRVNFREEVNATEKDQEYNGKVGTITDILGPYSLHDYRVKVGTDKEEYARLSDTINDASFTKERCLLRQDELRTEINSLGSEILNLADKSSE